VAEREGKRRRLFGSLVKNPWDQKSGRPEVEREKVARSITVLQEKSLDRARGDASSQSRKKGIVTGKKRKGEHAGGGGKKVERLCEESPEKEGVTALPSH